MALILVQDCPPTPKYNLGSRVHQSHLGFPSDSVVKSLSANAGDVGSIPGLGRSPGGRNGTWLQYFCLENPMDRRARKATVRRIAESRTWLKQLNTYTNTYLEVRNDKTTMIEHRMSVRKGIKNDKNKPQVSDLCSWVNCGPFKFGGRWSRIWV